jgi:O-glycosyl hydrolase
MDFRNFKSAFNIAALLVGTMMIGCSKDHTGQEPESDASYARFKSDASLVSASAGVVEIVVAWSSTVWQIEMDSDQSWITGLSPRKGGNSSGIDKQTPIMVSYSANTTSVRRSQDVFVIDSSSGERSKMTITQQANDAAVIEINPALKYQTVEGIGGGVANYEAWYCVHPNKEAIFDLIFKDLEVSMIRMGNWYEKNTPENPVMDYQYEIIQAARSRLGDNFSLMLSNWLVDDALIDRPGESGATLKKNAEGEFMYEAFGGWVRSTLEAYQQRGMAPHYLSMLNEPDGTNSKGDKILLGYSPNDSKNRAEYGKALKATYEYLQGVANRPKLIGPEVIGIGYNSFQNYYANLNPDYLDATAFHCYHGGVTSEYVNNDRYSSAHAFRNDFAKIAALSGDKPVMMTENCSYHPTVPADAVHIAHFIADSFIYANAAAYLHWALLWGYSDQQALKEGGDGCIAVEFPWSPSRWTDSAKGYVIRSEFYGLKHFTKHVKPGWKRIAANWEVDNIETVAFQDPTQEKITVVLTNYGKQDQAIKLNISDIGNKTTTVIQTDAPNERWYETLPDNDPYTQLNLPAMSISTVVIK